MAVEEAVKAIIAKQLDKDPSEFEMTTDLLEAGFESLDIVEMIFNLEDAFKINIPFNANETDVIEMKTVGDIVRMVENIQAANELPKSSSASAGDPDASDTAK